MTKVMKLHTFFDGYYGGHVDEYVLLPVEINGVLFSKLEEGNYSDAVYLGEIAGKHSECYGDLVVSFVNLGGLSVKGATDLVEGSDFSEFEPYFEQMESDFRDEMENEGKYDERKIRDILKRFDVSEDNYIFSYTDGIHKKFIEKLREKYSQSFKSITVLDEDYQKAIDILKDCSIELFD